MTITNGTVEFTRRVTTGDYQHKDAKVSLTFVVGDSEDALTMLEYVGNRAVERALAMVGEAPRPMTTKLEPLVKQPVEAQPWPGPTVGKPVGNVVDIMGVANPTVTAAPPAAEVAEPEAPAPQPAVISDKRLTDEVSARNAALITAAGADDTARQLATQRVLKLVDEFTGLPPGPGRLSKVPAERRAEFIERLAKLA
jgi:hypothetical protein